MVTLGNFNTSSERGPLISIIPIAEGTIGQLLVLFGSVHDQLVISILLYCQITNNQSIFPYKCRVYLYCILKTPLAMTEFTACLFGHRLFYIQIPVDLNFNVLLIYIQ